MTRAFRLLGLFPALFLITCSPPPFNLAISNSAKTAKKLTLVAQVGPLSPGSISLGSQGNEDVVFIPEKDGMGGITTQSGFVYAMDPMSGQQISFVSNNRGYGGPMPLGPLSTDSYPNFLVQSVKSAHNVIAFQYIDATPQNSQYMIATGNPGAGTFNSPGGWILLTNFINVAPFNPPIFNGKPIGASIYPDPNPTLDRSYWLFRQSGTNSYLEGEFDVSQNPIVPPGIKLRPGLGYDISPFVGNFAQRVLYYFNPVKAYSYVSLWNSPLSPNNWSTWVWIDNAPTYSQLTGIGSRIDALLTTGELFSTQGNVGNAYDPTTPTGTLEASFPLGDLRFIGETYIGGTASVLFSQALWFGNQVTFNVYSIPTSQLKTLGQ
jgi:hypothetical protein